MNTDKRESKLQSRLKSLRIQANLSQGELAEKAGLERKTINRIENGHFSPNISSLLRICGALKVKPSKILEGI
jgi:putative transcriptional regulator